MIGNIKQLHEKYLLDLRPVLVRRGKHVGYGPVNNNIVGVNKKDEGEIR